MTCVSDGRVTKIKFMIPTVLMPHSVVIPLNNLNPNSLRALRRYDSAYSFLYIIFLNIEYKTNTEVQNDKPFPSHPTLPLIGQYLLPLLVGRVRFRHEE